MTGRDQTQLDQEIVVAKLNRTMIGWANYFCLGPVSTAYRAVEQHARKRLASVVVCQAQSVVAGDHEVSEGIPARSAGPRLPYQADEQFPVGDTVNLSPRAGCGKSARPVR
jgi:hypothetical protein